MAKYALSLLQPDGTFIREFKGFEKLSWSRAVNTVGEFTVTFSLDVFDRVYYNKDRRLEIWRILPRGRRQLIMVGLLQYIKRFSTQKGPMITIAGPDQLDLLTTRVVEAAAGTSGSDKIAAADNMMKAYVRENLGASASSGRTLSTYLTVDADFTAGPTVEISAAYDVVLPVLQDLGKAAAQKDTPVYFDLVPEGSRFAFRTWANVRGQDRSNDLVLSEEAGTLLDPYFEIDSRDEKTYVYVNAHGAYIPMEDTNRSGASPFARREELVSGGNYTSSGQRQDAGRRRLREKRPRQSFGGKIVDIPPRGKKPGCQYGIHWDLGDQVGAQYDNESYTVSIHAVAADVTRRGETLVGELSVVE